MGLISYCYSMGSLKNNDTHGVVLSKIATPSTLSVYHDTAVIKKQANTKQKGNLHDIPFFRTENQNITIIGINQDFNIFGSTYKHNCWDSNYKKGLKS